MERVDQPEGLGPRGSALWRAINEDYTLDARELTQLELACRGMDDLDRLQAALAAADVVIPGARGTTRAHPLLAEVRGHRQNVTRTLQALSLPGEAIDAATARSNAGRRLASMRWGA